MDQNNSPLLLKILSGTYSGAELSLDGNEYILGSALECDIAIEDASLAPNHFKIRIDRSSPDGVSIDMQILATMLTVSHNNKKVDNISFKIKPSDRVQVGEFIFGIGPADEPWVPFEEVLQRNKDEEAAALRAEEEAARAADEKRRAAEEQEKHSQETDPSSASSQGTDDKNTPLDSHQEEGLEKAAQSVEAHEGIDASVEGEAPIGEEKKDASKLLLIGSIAISVILAVTITLLFTLGDGQGDSLTSLQVTKPIGIGNNSVSARNNQQKNNTSELQNSPTGSTTIIVDDQGVWQPTAEELELLERAKKSIRSMFDAFKFNHLKVEKGSEPLTVIIRGYTDRVDQWKKVKSLIDRDIGTLNQVLDYVETPWARKKQLEQMLIDRGLGEETQVYMTEQGLLVKTSLSAREEQRWARVESDYQDLYENNPPLFRIKDTAPWLDIKSVNFGYEPYLVTSDGTKYLVGAHVKNGYVLDKITPEGIVLKNDGLIKNLSLP